MYTGRIQKVHQHTTIKHLRQIGKREYIGKIHPVK